MLTLEEKNQLLYISTCLGKQLTEEQMEFASDFTKPTVSFSNPGTGKSYATVVGLIFAQTYRGVKGSKINAMSFTREATAELAARYTKACKELCITPTVKFATFHSLCLSVIKEKRPTLRVVSESDLIKDVETIEELLSRTEYPVRDRGEAKRVLQAINKLNSSLAFDDLNVEQSAAFKRLNLPLEIFQDLRVDWYLHLSAKGVIPQGDLPLFALYELCKDPDLQKRYKSMYRIMVVDEFQDLSLLNLRVLTLITENLVAIGDMKQQIYGFNGASQQIVDAYLKAYPNAKKVELTQSFRCRENISIFATDIVRRNFTELERFKGTAAGGDIRIERDANLDIVELVTKFNMEQKEGEKTKRSSMVLFRNNASAIPIAEELYKQKVQFRMPKFLPIYEMPIFRDLCTLVEAVRNPYNVQKVAKALEMFPEFKYVNKYNLPIIQEMQRTSRSFFQVVKNYQFTEESSDILVTRMLQVRDLLIKEDTSAHIFNALLPVYGRYIINNQWWRFPREKEYYFSLVQDIVERKTYEQMYNDEIAKVRFIDECEKGSIGIRCYTTHSAKGLEADDVYLLDAESGIFPNDSEINKLKEMECEYEAAKDIRNERNLLYVAVTRAKDSVTIYYRDSLTELLASPLDNKYNSLDTVYAVTKKDYDDVKAFEKLYRCGSKTEQGADTSDLDGLEAVCFN